VPSRRLLPIAAALCALLLAACGGDSQKKESSSPTVASTTTTIASSTTTAAAGGATTTAAGGMETHFTVTAKNVAFTPTKLTIPANEDVEITFDNQDSSVPHNLDIMTPTAFKTDVKSGPTKDTLKVNVAKAGTYDFQCDVHPTTMKGQITVS
jgi:plastocyanin